MVPKLPGSFIASKTIIIPFFLSGFSSGILNNPKALLEDFKLLIFCKSFSNILIILSEEISVLNSSVANKVSITKEEFSNSFTTFLPSAINK